MHYAECHYAECRCAGCHFTKLSGVFMVPCPLRLDEVRNVYILTNVSVEMVHLVKSDILELYRNGKLWLKKLDQGILPEGEGSIQLTSLY